MREPNAMQMQSMGIIPPTNQGKFEAWMRKVDLHISSICGMTSDDLADCAYRDMFDDEMTPLEAASEALQENGFDSEDCD